MKKVFSSNAQLTHVWAQQTQSEGRGNSLFFRDSTIWSYGEHFKAARIHVVQGKRFALVNSHRYSPSTGKHLNLIQSALNGLMPSFSCSDVDQPKKAVKELDANCLKTIQSALKRVKVTSSDGIQLELKGIADQYHEANFLRRLLGLAEKRPKASDLVKVRTHLKARLKRYQELNTPEMIERKRLAKQAKADHQAKLDQSKLVETILAFREGRVSQVAGIPHELLRIDGDVVKTSRGAEVPLAAAHEFLRALRAGLVTQGTRIGEFELTSTHAVVNQDFQDDLVVQIGCHKILLSEANQVLGA